MPLQELGILNSYVILDIGERKRSLTVYHSLAEAHPGSRHGRAPFLKIQVVACEGLEYSVGFISQPQRNRPHRRYVAASFKDTPHHRVQIPVT